jgi:hypothetical protein
MIICTISVRSLARCDWMLYRETYIICCAREMFEGRCPNRRLLDPDDKDAKEFINKPKER